MRTCSSQILRKTAERKELAKEEPLPVERSLKRKLATQAKSEEKRAKSAAVKGELMCTPEGESGSGSESLA